MELPREKKKVEILPKGSYFQTDKEGFLVNPASPEKLQSEWRPAIDDAIEAYKNQYGDKLKNVYVRGSVAKGEAVKGISDLDTFAYVDMPQDEITYNWARSAIEEMVQKYPFIEGFELRADALSEAPQDFLMLNQSMCVYGEPVEISKLRPGKEMVAHARALGHRLERARIFLQKDVAAKEIQEKCVWVMKTILRVGFEITMERSGTYTRDLYPCYKTFSEYYPEKEPQMRQVLDYALNPISDKEKIIEVIDTLGTWLTEETKKHF